MSKSLKDYIYEEDIELLPNNMVKIGSSVLDFDRFGSIVFEYVGSIYSDGTKNIIRNTIIRYKSNQSDRFQFEESAYEKLIFMWALFKSKDKLEKEKSRLHHENVISTRKIELDGEKRVNKILKFFIAILIFIVAAQHVKADSLVPANFPFTYIYDVNTNKCVHESAYRTKFSWHDLSNPKLVAEFPNRPGELVYVTPGGDMYVFTDTEERCRAYKKHFIEEMIRQNKLDEDRSGLDIDKE